MGEWKARTDLLIFNFFISKYNLLPSNTNTSLIRAAKQLPLTSTSPAMTMPSACSDRSFPVMSVCLPLTVLSYFDFWKQEIADKQCNTKEGRSTTGYLHCLAKRLEGSLLRIFFADAESVSNVLQTLCIALSFTLQKETTQACWWDVSSALHLYLYCIALPHL